MTDTALPITSGFNFRDLAGLTGADGRHLRAHRLLRTGAWNNLSDEDLAYLLDYGVTTVVDFRSLDESTPRPDRLPAGVEGVALPTFKTMPGAKQQSAAETVKDAANEPAAQVIAAFHDSAADLGLRRMQNVYTGLAESDSAAEAYREFFRLTLQTAATGGAIAFHCSAGKDRTGAAAYLLLAVLGVDHDAIVANYLASAQFNAAHIDARTAELEAAGAPANVVAIVRDRMTVRPEYLAAYEAALQAKWGGVQPYLREQLGVDEAMTAELRELLLV